MSDTDLHMKTPDNRNTRTARMFVRIAADRAELERRRLEHSALLAVAAAAEKYVYDTSGPSLPLLDALTRLAVVRAGKVVAS